MNKEYLFSRKFNGEEYKFYRKTMNMDNEIITYYVVDTPENSFGYHDHILFDNGKPYTMYRYCPQWILNACKRILIAKGYTV